MSDAISISNLSFDYFISKNISFNALENINLTIEDRDIVAIIGQNGSGKTTLVKHINGLLRPKKGFIKIFGENIEKKTMAEISKKVGYIFQNPDQQIFANSVKEEVEFGPRNLNLSEKEISLRCKKALEIVGLSKFLDVSPFSLSKGQKQGLAVASVLAMEPKILVMDEPTTGRDYLQSIQIMEIIKKMNQNGTTVVFITHNMQLVAKYANRVLVMKKGKIILDDPPKCVFKQQNLLNQTYLKPPQITTLSIDLWNPDSVPISINEFVTEFIKQKESAKK